MRAAYEKYREDGFEILSVSVEEDDAAVAGFVKRYGLDYPFLLDRDASVSIEFGVMSTPTTFFISPDGEIVATLAGTVNRGWLETNLTRYVSDSGSDG